MSATERRQVPRTKLEKLAYIHIEPDNGGIVLNVSDEGLAFHAMAPVEKNGQVLFSLKEQNHRIDVCGELIWTDDVQKIGGLRFTTLSNEARERIANLASHIEEPKTDAGSSLGAAFVRAFPNLNVRNLVPRIDAGDRLTPLKMKVRLRLNGFSGGLATGLLVSLLTGLIFAFSYAHRQQFGESLIRLGERMVSKTPARPAVPQPEEAARLVTQAPQNVAEAPAPVAAASVRELAASKKEHSETSFQDVVQIFPPPHANVTPKESDDGRKQPRSPVQSGKESLIHNESSIASATTSGERIAPPNAGMIASAAPLSSAPENSLPPQTAASPSLPARRGPTAQIQSESFSSSPALPVQRFFDLGKFKQQQTAQGLSERVAQLGMRTSVVNKGHLWMSSYQVLVGPYLTEFEEKKIHGDLVTNGINALPFERGSRGFSFRSPLTVGGSKLPVGEISITWETYVSEAKVRFMQGGAVLASANGSWIAHPQKFAHNEYVYENGGGNTRPLLEVHFAGLDRALVFR